MHSIKTFFFYIFIVLLEILLNTIPILARASDIKQQNKVGIVENSTIFTQKENFLGALEIGPELINNQLELRLAGNVRWYHPNTLWGLRFDGSLVQNELQHDMIKLLFSTGYKIDKTNEFVFFTSWLQRYAWENFNNLGVVDRGFDFSKKGINLGKQGLYQNQYTLGGEYRHELLPRGTTSLTPGMSIFLSSAYYLSEMEIFPWAISKTDPPSEDSILTRYLIFALGGGSRLEFLGGIGLSWQSFEGILRVGLRHKDWEEGGYIKGYSYNYCHTPGETDAPTIIVQLTWPDLLCYKLTSYYSWEPDLQIFGGSIQRNIAPQLSLVARTEVMQGGQELPDDIRYFCGLVYSFGEVQSEKSFKDDWLTPTYGAAHEYLAPHLRQLRISKWTEGRSRIPGSNIFPDFK